MVKRSARDSIRFDLKEQKLYLFGAARITYEDIELTAERITYDFNNEEVQAFGAPDSTGTIVGKPVFTQEQHKIEADTVRYSFRTGRGFIHEVRTNEQETWVHAHISKRHTNEEVHSRGGKLTTCDRPTPHYHFKVSRMMVIPDDKIVAGPAYMKLGKIPTPLAVPFGLFPNKRSGTMGVLIPVYGESQQLGFFLLNGGYYIPISDHLDAQITGDIYSRGSWALRGVTRYKTRYRYSGNLDISHSTLLGGDRDLGNFSKQQNFFVRWNHLVDPKASLTDRFSASVNMGTSQNFTNNFNSSTNDFLSNTFQSNISWSRIWPGKPYNLAVNMRHSQNTLNRTFDITVPSLTFNVTRFFPGQALRPKAVGAPKWYELIGVNLTSNFDNRLSTTEERLSLANFPSLMREVRNGFRHTAAVSTSIKNKYFTMNPEIRATERWYFRTLERSFDPETQTSRQDTVGGFARAGDWSMGVNLTSKLYGMYQFRGEGLKAIRHVITPNVGLSYRPDFDTQIEGPFGPGGALASYSPYDIGIYGKPPSGESGLLSLGLIQSVEAKVRDGKASEPGKPAYKKIRLIDFLGINGNYDWLRDSLRWTPVNVSARTSLFNKVNINFVSIWDPYAVNDLGQRIEQSELRSTGRLARLTNANLAAGFDLKSRRYGQEIGSGGQRADDDPVVAESDPTKGARVDFAIPWRLGVNYSYDVFRNYIGSEVNETVRQSVLFNGDLSVLKWWKLGFSSGYDLVAEEWTPTSLNLYWDLHCWEFNLNVIPIGLRRSFSFRINVKSAMLRDIKFEQRRPIGNDGELLF